jgi:cytosine deaminase
VPLSARDAEVFASADTERHTMTVDPRDAAFIEETYRMARQGGDAGGIPIGAVLVRDGTIVGRGHNQRIQLADPILHGEMDALRNAGRQRSYRGTTLYTSLSPCLMCAGTIVQFKIPRVVICENVSFSGNEEFLTSHGVEIAVINDERFIQMMGDFITAHPEEWNEDIGED